MVIIITSFAIQPYGLCCCKYSWYIYLLSIYEISPYDKSILNPQCQGFPKCCSPNPSLMLFYLLNKQTPCHPNPTLLHMTSQFQSSIGEISNSELVERSHITEQHRRVLQRSVLSIIKSNSNILANTSHIR